MLLSKPLISVAKRRLSSTEDRTEADLRRCVSDLYYSLFHAVCEALIEPVQPDPDNRASVETYLTLYRLPDHGYLEKKCKEVTDHRFSKEIRQFSIRLISLKNKRQAADYDPLAKFSISSVRNDLALAESALEAFWRAEQIDRARFAFFVSLRGRKSD